LKKLTNREMLKHTYKYCTHIKQQAWFSSPYMGYEIVLHALRQCK